MAFIDVVPASFSMTINGEYDQRFITGVIKNNAATAVDFTSWDSFRLLVSPATPGMTTKDPFAIGSVANGSTAGTLQIDIDVADAQTLAIPGQANMTVVGKKTSGDDEQVLATGTLTYKK